MPDKQLLEILACDEEGYHPQVWYEGWRVAFLNETEKFYPENIIDMQRHNSSDEVFVLLEGSFTLYIGDGSGNDVGEVTSVDLEKGKLYNVRKGVWHTHVTGKNAKVLIVENADVSDLNSNHTAFHIKDHNNEMY